MNKLDKPKGRPSNKHCVFGSCTSDSRQNIPGLRFLSFAQPCFNVRKCITVATPGHIQNCFHCTKSLGWIHNCGRIDGRFSKVEHVNKYKYICHKHFVTSDLLTKYPYPLPESVVLALNANYLRKNDNIPPESNSDQPETTAEFTERRANNVQSQKIRSAQFNLIWKEDTNAFRLKNEICPTNTKNGIKCEKKSEQIKVTIKQQKVSATAIQKKFKKTNISLKLFVQSLKTNEKRSYFYTGLFYDQILILLNLLLPVDNLSIQEFKKIGSLHKQNHTSLCELTLTLVLMRTGLLVEDLKFLFNLSEEYVSSIIIKWVELMYVKFNQTRSHMFCSREEIAEHFPKLPNLRVIIDSIYVFSQTAGNYELQDKSHTTQKILIGCTPNGRISFVSDIFERSISDKQLVKESGFLKLLEKDDLVTADRGFAIEEISGQKNVKFYIPNFLKERDHLTPTEDIETKEISNERICVERGLRRVKQFKIVTKKLPLKMVPILSQMIFVCCCLVNFQTDFEKCENQF